MVDFHSNIGYAFKYQGKRRLALTHYRKALRLSKKAHGKSHEMVAMCLNNLAGLHEADDDYEASLRLYHEALPIYKTACGPEDVMVARCLNNIGRVLTKALAPSEALPFHHQALAIYRAIHGDDHLFVADTHFFMGDAFLAIGQREQARQHYVKARPIYARYEGIDSPTYLKLMERLAATEEQGPHSDNDGQVI
jgi:tetratricopeptide (TPR) repeat protein